MRVRRSCGRNVPQLVTRVRWSCGRNAPQVWQKCATACDTSVPQQTERQRERAPGGRSTPARSKMRRAVTQCRTDWCVACTHQQLSAGAKATRPRCGGDSIPPAAGALGSFACRQPPRPNQAPVTDSEHTPGLPICRLYARRETGAAAAGLHGNICSRRRLLLVVQISRARQRRSGCPAASARRWPFRPAALPLAAASLIGLYPRQGRLERVRQVCCHPPPPPPPAQLTSRRIVPPSHSLGQP